MTTNDDLSYSQPENKKKRKALVIFLLLLLAFVLTIGSVIAYFSDTSRGGGNVTTGNLKITGSYTALYNGTETALSGITDIIPGDVIVIRGTITNTGGESAWVREQVTVTGNAALLPYLEIYNTELSGEQLLAGGNTPLALAGGTAVTDARVLNAAGGTTPTLPGFEYIDAESYNFAMTIYFSHDALNDAQNLNFDFEVLTQALQFENNNAAAPTEGAWATVEAASY